MQASDFNNLYVVTSLPNVVLSLVSAWFSIKIGITKAIILYSFTLLVGQSLITLAVWKVCEGWYVILLSGRFLIGFCGYALTSANLSLIPRYSDKKLMSLFVGIGSMIPWTTQSLSDLFTPLIYKKTGLVYYPFFVGWIVSIVSMVFALILFGYTKWLDKRRSLEEKEGGTSIFKFRDVKKLGSIMLVVFLIIFFAVGIEGSIVINANDMLH